MNINDVKKILKGFKIEYTGSGDKVLAQMLDGNVGVIIVICLIF